MAKKEENNLRNKFNAATTAAERDAVYEEVFKDSKTKFDDDRTVGRPRFIKGHSYIYKNDTLAFFKDSDDVEHPYIEIVFSDVATNVETKASLSFWRKSVAQEAGSARSVTYESTECDGLGSSDKAVLHSLRNGVQINCIDVKSVKSGLKYVADSKSWTGVANSKTYVYKFEV